MIYENAPVTENILSITLLIPMRNESLFAKKKILEVLDEIYDLNHVKLIIVDSNSADGTSKIVESTLIESNLPKERWSILKSIFPGKTRALNLAITEISSDLVMIMDVDAEASLGWENICQEIFTQDDIGLISGIQTIDGVLNMSNLERKYKQYLNQRRLFSSQKSSIVIPEGSLCCFRRLAIRNNQLDERFNADDTQISLICLRNQYRCIIDPRLKFKENQKFPWHINFRRRVRRGRGLTNVLIRNIDMVKPSINLINHKEILRVIMLYLILPWVIFIGIMSTGYGILTINFEQVLFYYLSPLGMTLVQTYVALLGLFIYLNMRFPLLLSILEGSMIMIIAQISIITHRKKDFWDPIRKLEYLK